MNLYYKIWIDCIIQARQLPNNKKNWKLLMLIIMSLPMGLNFMMLVSILQRNWPYANIYDISIDLLPGRSLDAFLEFFILYYFPFIFFNYLLVFYNNKYEALLKTYEKNNGKLYKGKLFLTSFFISLGFPVLVVLLAVLYVSIWP